MSEADITDEEKNYLIEQIVNNVGVSYSEVQSSLKSFENFGKKCEELKFV